jgi:hypothetical protein
MHASVAISANRWLKNKRGSLSVVGALLAGAAGASLWLSGAAESGVLHAVLWAANWFAFATIADSFRAPTRSGAALQVLAGVLVAVLGGWIVLAPSLSVVPVQAVPLAFVGAALIVTSGVITWSAAGARSSGGDGGELRPVGRWGRPGVDREPAGDFTELWLRVGGSLAGLIVFAAGWVVGAHHPAGYGLVGVGAVTVVLALFMRR